MEIHANLRWNLDARNLMVHRNVVLDGGTSGDGRRCLCARVLPALGRPQLMYLNPATERRVLGALLLAVMLVPHTPASYCSTTPLYRRRGQTAVGRVATRYGQA